MNRLSAAAGCVLLLQVLSANAQTVYVDDRLQIGLHTQPALSSAIAELLPSGTELQLIERNGALARVRTAAGTEGWVDGSYVSSEQPARERVQTMEAELAGAQAALADLQARLVTIEQQPQPAATEQPGQLPSESLREMQLLAEENQRLKQLIAELEAVRRMTEERAASAAATARPTLAASAIDTDDEDIDITMLKRWHVILFASVLLLAFSIGGWLVDWSIRRRHGGFRV